VAVTPDGGTITEEEQMMIDDVIKGGVMSGTSPAAPPVVDTFDQISQPTGYQRLLDFMMKKEVSRRDFVIGIFVVGDLILRLV